MSMTKWALIVFTRESGKRERPASNLEPSFWHATRDAAIVEGKRSLRELESIEDSKDWIAYAFPDPFELSSERPWRSSVSELQQTRK